jgi:hypothetical protein
VNVSGGHPIEDLGLLDLAEAVKEYVAAKLSAKLYYGEIA